MATKVPGPRPKDSMKSTWRNWDRKTEWNGHHYFLNFVNPFEAKSYSAAPKFAKDDPIPVLSVWSCHLFIILHAAWPMAVQYAYCLYFGRNMQPLLTFFLYASAWTLNALREVNLLHKIGQKTGYLDGEKPRDEVPDVGVRKALLSLQLTTTVRPIFTVFLAYKSNEAPNLSWWLPLELFLYSIVLDFWFYVYHRACHEVNFLWRYHRTHHLTKHPNPFLSAYSDAEQEILEIVVIPLLTYSCLKFMGLPMGFYDWWVCHQYLIFSESLGHSGLRIYASTPGVSSPILSLFGCELLLEDHDLHHRKGWRQSQNYGKQTRLWDRLFGTCGERIESFNPDYKNAVNMPLW